MKKSSIEEKKNRMNVLKNLIQDGVNSKRVKNFDPKEYLEDLKKNKTTNC